MATRRTQIIDALIADLEANTEVASGNVHKRYKYLDEVNDFPSITFEINMILPRLNLNYFCC